MNASSVRESLREVVELQGAMLQCLAEEDIEKLGDLDMRCRELFASIDIDAIDTGVAALVESSLRGFLEFHQELQRACIEQRDEAAADLKRLRSAQKGVSSYQETEDRAG